MKKSLRLAAASVAAVLGLPAALPPAATVAGAATTAATATATATAAAATVAVIVQAPGAHARVAEAVRDLGGTVTRALPIVNGFAALVPETALSRLEAERGVRAVTPDAPMRPQHTGAATPNLSTVKSVFREEVGADQLNAAGFTGAGVRIALIDTGVDTEVSTAGDLAGKVVPVQDPMVQPSALASPPLVPCVNFSGEDHCDDSFGHGTFMAGLMVGSGAASAGRYKGVAPGADVVSIKVGGRDGSADVSKVLAAIQWAVSFKDVYDIQVLNLSLGTDSTVPPTVDPLNLAVQRAWVSGLTVVVSAGNFGAGPRARPDGSTYGTVTKPGDDPFVITVGSSDDRETPALDDDRLPHFSSWGPTFHGLAKPDVIAPGGRVISLRAPGSLIDDIDAGKLDPVYRRGSGTSMSAAITSGLAALLLDARDGDDGRPAWRPDDVKASLIAGANKIKVNEPRAVGAGLVNGPKARAATISPDYRTSVLSDGSGTLDGSRGTNRVAVLCPRPIVLLEPDPNCWQTLEGEQTAEGNNWQGNNWQGNNWQGAEYASSEWTPQTWYESQWVNALGNNWQGNNWQATTWAEGNNWQGNNWQGSSWNGQVDDTSYGRQTKGSGSYGAWG